MLVGVILKCGGLVVSFVVVDDRAGNGSNFSYEKDSAFKVSV